MISLQELILEFKDITESGIARWCHWILPAKWIMKFIICISFFWYFFTFFCYLWDSFDWLPSMKLYDYANLHKVVNLIFHSEERPSLITVPEKASLESLILRWWICKSQCASKKMRKKKMLFSQFMLIGLWVWKKE